MGEETRTYLPAICLELRLRADGDDAIVNSRDVAEAFEKQHPHVLRDIDGLCASPSLTHPNVDASAWFRPIEWIDAKGEARRSFDLTRDGFMLLVMGWTGPKALRVKVRYIEAFNAMERTIKGQYSGMLQIDRIFAGMMEAHTQAMGVIQATHVNHIALRSDVDVIRTDLVEIKEDVGWLKQNIKPPGRIITKTTRQLHVAAIVHMGGNCPCCGVAKIVANDGKQSQFAEFDHFYTNSLPNADHTWLICKPCHKALSYGKVARQDREAEFRAYQQKRLRLPGAQALLPLSR